MVGDALVDDADQVRISAVVEFEAELSLGVGLGAGSFFHAVGELEEDNIVAGGIGNGHGLQETLLKEGEEEASIPRNLTSDALPAGAVSYRMESELGVRDDVLFVFDLEMPADFVPKNQDGEIAHFELMPVSAILDRVRTSDDFKFNVNLVILDFALRHGVLRSDDPEYLEIATGLHRPLD